MRRIAFLLSAALALCALSASATLDAAEQGVRIASGDRLSASVAAADVDAFDIDLPAGGFVELGVKAAPGSLLLPDVRMFRPDGTEFDLASLTTGAGTVAIKVKRFQVPDDATGRWQIRVAGRDGTTGAYQITPKLTWPAAQHMRRVTVPAAASLELPFVGASTAAVSVRITPVDGISPTRVAVRDPAGTEVAGSAALFTIAPRKPVKGRLTLDQGLGVYTLVLEAPDDSDVDVDVDVTVKLPKVSPRKLTVPTEARVDEVTPGVVRQEDTDLTVRLAGAALRDGTQLRLEGEGVTASSGEFVDATTLRFKVDVAADAPYGPRRIVVLPPRALGESFEVADAFTVTAPDPTITAVTPSPIEQSTAGAFTVTGTGFRAGGTVELSGEGLALADVAIVSATEIRATYTASPSATLGFRKVTYAQPAAGGGASASLTDAVTVVPHAPVLTGVSPASLPPATSHATVRLSGAFFDPAAGVAFTARGVTVHSLSFVNAGAIDADVSVALDATPGLHGVTVTPGPGGAPERSFAQGLIVLPHDPVPLSFSHAVLGRGAAGVPVTVTGREFRAGDTLSADGGGVSFSSVSVVSPSTITALVTVGAGAASGARALTVTHPANDGGRAATLAAAFRVSDTGPAITSIAPSIVGATGVGGAVRQVPVEITGTNFMTGADVAVTKTSAAGLSVVAGSVSVVSDTRVLATVSVAGDATIGLWNVVVTNPGGAGASGFSGANLLEVKPATALVVQRVIASSGSAYGGERVTIEGTGFAAGAVVDFGSVRAAGTFLVDANTIVTTVPAPASVSAAAPTRVSVKVTNPGGANASASQAYAYAADESAFVTLATFPAQGASTVPRNLKSAVVVLSAPLDPATGLYGNTAGTHTFWYENGGSFVSAGLRGVGPGGRFLVFSRIGIGNLDISAAGLYVLDIPVALKSIAGAPFTPTRLSALAVHDQQTFTVLPAGTDTTAPTLSSATPAASATGVDVTARAILSFSEAIDPLTVTSASITLQLNSVNVPAAYALSADLRTVTITPIAALAANTTYTLAITNAAVLDLCGNAVAATSRTFTTGNGTDTVKPTVDAVVIEGVPATLDGSGTYVAANGTPGQDFDLYLPREGWSVEVSWSDAGGAAIDTASFSAKCSAAVGSYGANAELGGLFTVTPTSAKWRVPASLPVTAGQNVTFTFTVSDTAGNTSLARTVTVDVADKDATAVRGGDHDPLDGRRAWILRTDLDAFSAAYTSTTSPSNQRGATTTLAANGTSDLGDALVLVGLGTTSMTPAAAATTAGPDTGTNAIVRRLVAERTRELLNERFGIDADGTHGEGAADLSFLLPGEQGSLPAMPTYSSANASNSANAYSEISIGGTVGAESNAYASSASLGDAWYDERNRREEANLNLGGVTDTGVYLLGALKLQVNANALFRYRVSDKFVAIHGGTPVGEDASDDDVLAGTFDRLASSNVTFNARYDAIHDAIECVALYTSALLAHEVGHSLGLVADGAPKTGLFGGAHYLNAFTQATSASPNTSRHLDYAGNDLMAGASSFDTTIQSGTQFKRFSPLDIAYLLNHLIYDEGK